MNDVKTLCIEYFNVAKQKMTNFDKSLEKKGDL